MTRRGVRERRGLVLSGVSGAFSMQSLPGLLLDFDMQDPASYVLAGSNISDVINRKTSTAYHQATAGSRASFEADSLAVGLNGFPCAHPDGGDFYLGTEAAILNVFANGLPHTLFYVAQPDSSSAIECLYGAGNSASASGYRVYGQNTTSRNMVIANTVVVDGTTPTDTAPHVFAFRHTGAAVSSWINGVADMVSVAQDVGVTTLDRHSFFSRPRSANDIRYIGRCAGLWLYSGTLSDSEVAQASSYLYARWQLGYDRVVYSGDSLSRGFGSVSGQTIDQRISPAETQQYNAATNGWQTAQVIGTLASLVTIRRRAWTTRDIHVLWIGSNDVKFTSDSAATIYSRISSIISSVKGSGYKSIVSTVTHRTSSEMSGDGVTLFNTVCDSLNALILGNAAGADVVVDAQAYLTGLGATSDSAPNAWYSDSTHLQDLTYNGIAALVKTAIDSL